MNRSSEKLSKEMFNVIYVEDGAYAYPITQKVLERYSDRVIIPIRHYKDVFNRPNQHFGVQKEHQSLILAVKREPFLYKGPEVCQNFGYKNFYYTSFLLNCIFDCEYCYLQGMYGSANLVAFVNLEDFKDAVSYVVNREPVFLAASYDTDLIGFHNVIPYMDYFYDFFKKQPNLFVEVRTKSGNQSFYRNHTPLDNLIIAFTLTPEGIIQKYEKGTPPLSSRIKAIQTAMEHGFKVRICLDPIFINEDTASLYEPFFNFIFTQIDTKRVIDVGYGFFRMSREFFKRIKKQRVNSRLFSEEYNVNRDIVSYPQELMDAVSEKHYKILTQYIEKEKIFSL